jgi:signal peptidase II
MDDIRTSERNESPRSEVRPSTGSGRGELVEPPDPRADAVAVRSQPVDAPTTPDTGRRTSDSPGASPLVGRGEIWIALAVVLLDQMTKAMVRAWIPLHDDVSIINGLLDFTQVRNTGAAFGLLNSVAFPFKTALIAIVAAVALVAIAAYAARVAPAQKMARLGLALILGGAIGNLIDRITLGYVVDFVDVYWRSYHFWAFNVADSAITVGVSVMVLDMLGLGSHVSKTA